MSARTCFIIWTRFQKAYTYYFSTIRELSNMLIFLLTKELFDKQRFFLKIFRKPRFFYEPRFFFDLGSFPQAKIFPRWRKFSTSTDFFISKRFSWSIIFFHKVKDFFWRKKYFISQDLFAKKKFSSMQYLKSLDKNI